MCCTRYRATIVFIFCASSCSHPKTWIARLVEKARKLGRQVTKTTWFYHFKGFQVEVAGKVGDRIHEETIICFVLIYILQGSDIYAPLHSQPIDLEQAIMKLILSNSYSDTEQYVQTELIARGRDRTEVQLAEQEKMP